MKYIIYFFLLLFFYNCMSYLLYSLLYTTKSWGVMGAVCCYSCESMEKGIVVNCVYFSHFFMNFVKKQIKSTCKVLTKHIRSTLKVHTKYLESTDKVLTKYVESTDKVQSKVLTKYIESTDTILTKCIQSTYKVRRLFEIQSC